MREANGFLVSIWLMMSTWRNSLHLKLGAATDAAGRGADLGKSE
jgi:hypothetical protein